MAVGADVIADGPAPEFVAGDAVDLAHDVPEGEVDARDGGAADRSVAVPEVLAVHHLPEVFDACGVFADEEVFEVLDRADDASRVPLEGRFAPAPEPGLIGVDLDEDPVSHACVADDGLDFGDFHASSRGWLEGESGEHDTFFPPFSPPAPTRDSIKCHQERGHRAEVCP